jgi:hypothetical protein
MKTNGDAIRGQVRVRGFERLSHGLYRPQREGLTAEQEWLRELAALLLVLPDDAVFTHVTAARLLGWQLPKLPEQTPVFAAVRGKRRPRRHGLITSRLKDHSEVGTAHGLPIDSPEEILLRAARDLGLLDLLILVDSALHLGHLDPDRLAEILESGRPGTVRLRQAYALADRRAESAGETVLRAFHIVMEVPVTPQAPIHDDAGNLIGVVDLLVDGSYRAHEYDGAGHRDGKAHAVDLRRERGWANSPYNRSGYTLDDLLNHPIVLMHELDRIVGRPHALRRVTRWRTVVDESLYGESGRMRVMNRWKRAIGVVEWPGTA